MTIQLGQIAPDFEQDTANGSIRFHAWLGEAWGLLFSHPRDFTQISTAELVGMSLLKPECEQRNIKPVALMVDTAHAARECWQEIEATQGRTLTFPLVADSDHHVADLYGMVHPEVDPDAAVRCLFVIDPAKRVRLVLTYPPGVGRNFKEVLRVIDGLQDLPPRQTPQHGPRQVPAQQGHSCSPL